MSQVLNTLGNVTNGVTSTAQENKVFYDRVLIERLLPNLLFAKYGQKRPYNRHEGDTVNFRKFNSLNPATTPLTEGVTPDGSALVVTSVQATVRQYGDYIKVSDRLDMLGIDPVITQAAEVLGEQAALTIDSIVRDVVVAGTNKQYAGGKDSRFKIEATGKISAAEIKKAVRTLKNYDARPLEDGFFIGIVDPDIAYDLQSDSLWQDVSKYNGGENIIKGEIGKLAGVRFVETTNVKVVNGGATASATYTLTSDTAINPNKAYYTQGGTSPNYTYSLVASPVAASLNTYYEPSANIELHCAMIIGKDAYGIVDVNGSSKPEIIVKPAGSAGSADPLNQRSTVGWKADFTAVRLNEEAMVRLEVAVSE